MIWNSVDGSTIAGLICQIWRLSKICRLDKGVGCSSGNALSPPPSTYGLQRNLDEFGSHVLVIDIAVNILAVFEAVKVILHTTTPIIKICKVNLYYI
ncbi:hypothetical protein HanRHA438_Chr09g0415621 [Helianthus annuus]|nr:hypothetical protein HanRHA438_Chr09g0415621 [Helianthus annuus]